MTLHSANIYWGIYFWGLNEEEDLLPDLEELPGESVGDTQLTMGTGIVNSQCYICVLGTSYCQPS